MWVKIVSYVLTPHRRIPGTLQYYDIIDLSEGMLTWKVCLLGSIVICSVTYNNVYMDRGMTLDPVHLD